MKTRDNDEVLESYFQAELNKIPSFFRLNKLSMGIAVSIGVLVVIFLQCAVFFIKARGNDASIDYSCSIQNITATAFRTNSNSFS